MPRLLRPSTVLIAGVLGLGALGAPAQADPTSASASAGPGVLYDGCTDHPINYSVAPPLNAYTWSLQLVFQAPDGTSAGSAYISKGDPTTGVETKQFCPGEDLPGSYSVTGTYSVMVPGTGSGSTTTTTAIAPFSFDLRLPTTQVTAKASEKKPKVGKQVKVRVTVSDERPSGGLFGTSSAKVQLQRKKGAKWVSVAGANGYTKSSGKALLKFKQKWKGKTTFRVVADLDDLGSGTSSAFKLRGR
ncbi:hypothetical protein [Nocardioides houyundeii]|uniref:hypothetical protein n=1 Tax=Nocardioides houyundeii TaxID=2045452 RepID=UPI0013B4522E|nr:hypothetical protein [Nocardioides houyundeii]